MYTDLFHKALARRLAMINLVMLRQLQRRNDTLALCKRPAPAVEQYAPHGLCGGEP